MRNDLTTAQVENKKLANTLALLEKNMADERIEKTKEYQELKKTNTFEIAKYENMLTDYKLYMSERDARQKEINELLEQREIEIANRIRDVADKEREKVQATDKIRDGKALFIQKWETRSERCGKTCSASKRKNWRPLQG